MNWPAGKYPFPLILIIEKKIDGGHYPCLALATLTELNLNNHQKNAFAKKFNCDPNAK